MERSSVIIKANTLSDKKVKLNTAIILSWPFCEFTFKDVDNLKEHIEHNHLEYKGSKLSQNLSSLCEDCGLTYGEEEFKYTQERCLVLLGWVPCNKCGLVLAVLQEHMFREELMYQPMLYLR